jgi:hypothetical protein
MTTCNNVLDHLRVHLDASNRSVQRRRPLIQQACSARAHQQNTILDFIGVYLTSQKFPGRDKAARLGI